MTVCARPFQLSQEASAAQQSAQDEEAEDDDFIDRPKIAAIPETRTTG